jgi:hypothetical protein
VSFCAAVDISGNVATSTHPTGGASAWHVGHTAAFFNGISCASSSLCVGVDNDGNVVSSTDPASSKPTWKLADVEPTPSSCADGDQSCPIGLQNISCPSSSLCLATDDKGDVVSSTDPAGGAGAWTVSPAGILDLSCPTITLCVAVDGNGVVLGTPAARTTARAGHAAVARQTVRVDVSCVGPRHATCTITAAIRIPGDASSAAATVTITGGAKGVIPIALSRADQRQLFRHHRLAAVLVVTQDLSTGRTPIRRQRIRLT